MSQLSSTETLTKVSLVLLPLLSISIPTMSASAQVISAEEGSQTVITTVGDRIDITGGQTSADNSNLFQSFEQFDLEAQQTANFITAPTIQNVIGTVDSSTASTINGTLQVSGSDANLYLMNPAGILIGPEAHLNLPGSFTATTATGISFEEGGLVSVDHTDYNALNGKITTLQFQENQPGSVVHIGDLTVQQGESINLIGGSVVNTGSLTAPEGTITLAAVDSNSIVRLQQGQQLLSFEVEALEVNNRRLSREQSALQPTSISEMLTGGNLSSATKIVTNPDGSVQLLGQQERTTEAGGRAITSGTLSTAGNIGGNINVLGDRVILNNAELNASGSSQGGLIRIGGDYKGNGTVYSAIQTNIDQTSTLTADALDNGDGGQVIAWSDELTSFSGHISARGGLQGGNGGFSEVSGKTELAFNGIADLSAPRGEFGTLLLDPENWIITDSIFPPSNTATTSYISALALTGQSEFSDVVLEATNNITVEDLDNFSLLFRRGSSVSLIADSDNSGVGAFTMLDPNDPLIVEQGDLTISGAGITVGRIESNRIGNLSGGFFSPIIDDDVQGGNVTLTSSQSVVVNSINTGVVLDPTELVNLDRENYADYGGDITITAASGDITINNFILTSFISPLDFAGEGGDITLTANGNIQTGLLQSTSVTDGENASQAGDIAISSLAGNVLIEELINAQSTAINNAGNGGDISIQANNGSITTNVISTASEAELDSANNGGANAGAAGDISLTSRDNLSTKDLKAFSQAEANAGNGGDITLVTNNGNISTSALTSISNALSTGTSSNGGDISLTASGNIEVSDVQASSVSRSDTGNGGDIFIESSNGEILVDDIRSESIATTNNSGNGGNIELNANGKIDIDNDVVTSSIAGGNTSGQSGTIQITGNGVIVEELRSLSAASINAGDAGLIDVNGQRVIRISSGIDASSIGGGNSADIQLTGNGISFGGGDNSIVGNTVLLEPASIDQKIGIGFDSGLSGSLDVVISDLDAISNSVSNIIIGRTDGTGEIILNDAAFISEGNPRAPIQIVGGGQLNGPNTDTRIHLTGAGEGYFQDEDIAFSNIESLIGGDQNDTFLPELGVAIEAFNSIDGGGGFNLITYSGWAGAPVTLDLSAFIIDNIQTLIGSGNGSTLIGDDSGQDWIIDGSNSGSVNELVFESFNNLAGGIGDDTFSFINNGNLSGTIGGAGGQDSLDYAAFNGPINIDIANSSASALSSFSSIENFTGSSNNNDVLLGSNNDETFELTSNSSGNINNLLSSPSTFNGIEIIDGQGGNNTISIENLAPTTNSNWIIDGSDSGSINSIDFNNFSNLVGNALDDTFNFTNSSSLSGTIDGAGGSNSINYAAFTNSVVIDLETNSASGVAGFSEISTLIGSTNNDTLRGSNLNETFFISGLNSGNIDGAINFSSFELLDAQAGSQDTLNFSNYTTPVEVNLATATATDIDNLINFESFVGGSSSNDTFFADNNNNLLQLTANSSGSIDGNINFNSFEAFDGQAGQNTLSVSLLTTLNSFDIDGDNSGSINGQSFNNFANLIGSAQNDSFNFINDGNLSGTIDGENGQDTLNYSTFNNAVAVDITTLNSIETLVGSSNNDILIGSNFNDTFSINDNNAGIVNSTLSFSSFESIDGRDGNETFSFINNGNLSGTVAGASGQDTLDYAAATNAVSIDITTLNSIETLIGSTNDDTLIGSNFNDTFSIDRNNAGTVNGSLNFAGFESIDAQNGDDTFSFINNGSVTGTVKGANGQDTLNYAAATNAVTIDITTLDSIETLVGSANNDTLIGSNNSDTFSIDRNNAGNVNGSLNFSSFESLNGQDGDDTFRFINNGSVMGTVEGGNGQDTLNYAAAANAVVVDINTLNSIETLIGSSSNDTLVGSNSNDTFSIDRNNAGIVNGSLNFSSFESLDGQNGDDTFRFINNGNLSGAVEGSLGNDTLNYSSASSPISVDLYNNSISSLNFSNIENVAGSTNPTDDYIRGSQGNDTFEITGENSGTISTPNIEISFSEIEILDGGNGENIFKLNNSRPNTSLNIRGGSNLDQSNNIITNNFTNTTWELYSVNNGRIQQNGNTIAEFRDIQNLVNASPIVGEQRVEFTSPISQITNSLDSGSSDLILIGNDINIGKAIAPNNIRNGSISGSGTLTIRPANNDFGIELGGLDSQDPTKVNITDGELAAIQDGFINILVGGAEQTGDITLGGDAEFRSEITLQSQGNIDTTGGELRGNTTDSNITIETNESLNAGNISTKGSNVNLTAQEDISVAALSTAGSVNGQGIFISSGNGSVTIANSVESLGTEVGNDINITAQTDVNIGGDIVTSGGDRSGDLNITASNGALTTGNIITANGNSSGSMRSAGSVLLDSASDIQVGFINARGSGINTEDTTVNITTPTNFIAQTALEDTEASVSTTGTQNGSITIEYGDPAANAIAFTVQNNSGNGTSGGIATPLTELTIGEFTGSYTQENISLINRGIAPIEPPVAPAEPGIESLPNPPTSPSIKAVLAQTETFTRIGSGDAPLILPNTSENTSAERQELENIFKTLETSNGNAFESYLSSSGQQIEAPVRTLYEVQEKLSEVERSTEAQPAIIYAYFVPISPSVELLQGNQNESTNPEETSASSPLGNRSNQPEDQLEIMLITANSEPQRFRQWGITREQVEQTTQNLRKQVTRQFSTAKQYLPPAQQLYDWIVGPAKEHLEENNINSLGFVMDEGLRTLPIATLHDGDQYLIENYSLGLLPTISLTNFDNTNVDRNDFETAQVLAMGASEFTDLPPLPAVEEEVNVITDTLLEGDAFLNEDFVRENLQSQLQEKDYEILHLATHASFTSSNLEESYIQLWNEKLSLDEIQEIGLNQHMLDLIILSACNTALGDPASEYGFAGFAVNSGATTAVASIWPVSDEGTLGFMNEFYSELHRTALRSEAVRQAQLTLMRGNIGINEGTIYGPNAETIAHIPELSESGQWDFSHPFYWSAFTAIGNPW
ncbi:MAG: CHAT domain-containing protein [Phormidesmis sp.]